MTKEQRQFYLGRGLINYIINWKAGLTAFGQVRVK
jgi:hypothetical protein